MEWSTIRYALIAILLVYALFRAGIYFYNAHKKKQAVEPIQGEPPKPIKTLTDLAMADLSKRIEVLLDKLNKAGMIKYKKVSIYCGNKEYVDAHCFEKGINYFGPITMTHNNTFICVDVDKELDVKGHGKCYGVLITCKESDSTTIVGKIAIAEYSKEEDLLIMSYYNQHSATVDNIKRVNQCLLAVVTFVNNKLSTLSD